MFTPASHVKCKAGDAWIDKRPYRERDFSSPRTEEKRKEEKRKEKREGRENSTPSYRGKELGAAVVHLAGRRRWVGEEGGLGETSFPIPRWRGVSCLVKYSSL